MMRHGSVVRDLALLCVAVAVGVWLRDGGTTVMAQRSVGSSSALAFQMTGTGPDALLTLYNSDSHTLYIYPRIGAGSSTVNCAYSFKVTSPGAPLQRENCPVGGLVPQSWAVPPIWDGFRLVLRYS
jgi:hypothetical protein